MKKYLLVLALLFGLPEITTYAQDVEAYNTSVLAGRPTNPMIVDGVGEDSRFEAITAMWGDSANLYVADSNTVRRIELSTARVTTRSEERRVGKECRERVWPWNPREMGELSGLATP